ncbi:hypothetical protein CEXT_661721 [Caerostris extrusa]|uniref:Uncharacterized protein n=1 Tax=Caerostris extrusa TaxID=172846 RepID=A0AAV4X752_CAEEX|nr:hypothetical protein CEXT_661721 [Caerostris extrusa]
MHSLFCLYRHAKKLFYCFVTQHLQRTHTATYIAKPFVKHPRDICAYLRRHPKDIQQHIRHRATRSVLNESRRCSAETNLPNRSAPIEKRKERKRKENRKDRTVIYFPPLAFPPCFSVTPTKVWDAIRFFLPKHKVTVERVIWRQNGTVAPAGGDSTFSSPNNYLSMSVRRLSLSKAGGRS